LLAASVAAPLEDNYTLRAAKVHSRLRDGSSVGDALTKAEKWNSYCSDLELKRSMPPSSSIELSSEISHSKAPSNITVVQSTKPGETSCPIGNKRAKDVKIQESKDQKWREELVKAHQDIAAQSNAQVFILAEQNKAITLMADESIVKIDLETISESRRPFFEWKQKKVLEKMAREQAEEEEAKKEGRRG
jgi:hypothetical protein